MNFKFISAKCQFLSSYFSALIGYDFEFRDPVLKPQCFLSGMISLGNLIFSVPLVSQMWMIAYEISMKSMDFQGFQWFRANRGVLSGHVLLDLSKEFT